MDLSGVSVGIVAEEDEARFRELTHKSTRPFSTGPSFALPTGSRPSSPLASRCGTRPLNSRLERGARKPLFAPPSPSPQAAYPKRLPELSRGHLRTEASHHVLDWSFVEDRIRTSRGSENTTRLRRSAVGKIRQRGPAVAKTMRRLDTDVHCKFKLIKITGNTSTCDAPPVSGLRTQARKRVRHEQSGMRRKRHRIRQQRPRKGLGVRAVEESGVRKL